ncbi:hypothetical protein PCNPT3_10350 [Psychromonas sp. CNPT3]|nr:hypothetical protein PCNPT3_10350 [Psychromonas sp. CNPT3]
MLLVDALLSKDCERDQAFWSFLCFRLFSFVACVTIKRKKTKDKSFVVYFLLFLHFIVEGLYDEKIRSLVWSALRLHLANKENFKCTNKINVSLIFGF